MRHVVATVSLALLCSALAAQPKGGLNWTEAAAVKTGPQAGKLVLADFNADGRVDVAVACGACCGDRHCADGGHIAVMMGDGRGRLATPVRISLGPTALCVAAGDINGDGKVDLVAGEHDSYDIKVMLGDGKGGFSKRPAVPSRDGSRPHTHDLALGDVTGDGRLDAVAINANDNTISVLAGDGAGGLSPAPGSPFAAGRHPYEGLRLIDVNGDGSHDAVVSNVGGNAVNVLINDGEGRFAPSTGAPFRLGARPGFVNASDLNQDGAPDIVSTHDDSGLVKVLLGDGKGGFTPGPELTAPDHLWGTALSDVDGDGTTDLVATAWAGRVHVMTGDGRGGFKAGGTVLSTGGRPSYVGVGDLNGDGRADLVTSHYQSGEVRVWVRE